jgi:hypothetical protein
MSGWHRHAVTAAVAKGRTTFRRQARRSRQAELAGLACMAFVSANRQGDFFVRGFVSGLKIPFPRERRQRSQRLGSNVLTAAEDLIAVSSRARRFNDLALMA